MNFGCQLFLLELLLPLQVTKLEAFVQKRHLLFQTLETQVWNVVDHFRPTLEGWKWCFGVSAVVAVLFLSKGPEIGAAGLQNFRSAKLPTLRFGWQWAKQNPVLSA